MQLYLKVMCGTGLESFMEFIGNCSALTEKDFPCSAVSLSTKALKQKRCGEVKRWNTLKGLPENTSKGIKLTTKNKL